jgi:hypothetical protein
MRLEDNVLVTFGGYGFEGILAPKSDNVASLDYSVACGVRIANFKTDTAAYTNLNLNSTPLKYHHA